jgi:hypothetical protein
MVNYLPNTLINSNKFNLLAISENTVVVSKKIAEENTIVLSNSVNFGLTKGLNLSNRKIIT